MTLSNALDKSTFIKGSEVIVNDVKTVKQYSCLQGLVALDKSAMDQLPTIREAMLKVRKMDPPTYN